MDDLRELRISKQLPAKDMVSVVRDIYPKYDKTMQSKCERGSEYGVQLKQDAMTALLTKFAPERLKNSPMPQPPPGESPKIAKKKVDGHRLTCRISCRLEDDEYKALKEYVKTEGFDTMQAWLTHKVRQYIRNKARKSTKKTDEQQIQKSPESDEVMTRELTAWKDSREDRKFW